jgi:Mg-chelatase subunit ChlD
MIACRRSRVTGKERETMRALSRLLGLVLALASPCHGAVAAERVASAIVFAVDVSGSVSPERYQLQRAGIADIFASTGIENALGDGLAVAVMEWSDGHAVVVPWTILRSVADAQALAARIRATPRAPGYSTELSLALLAAADLLDACACDAASRVIDLSGDGPNNGPMSTTIARDQVVARGIRINGLPIVTPEEPDLAQWYQANVVGGPGAFLEVANGFEDFARAMRRKFFVEVAGGHSRRPPPLHAAARP